MSKSNDFRGVTPEGRLLFPHLFEPTTFENSEKKTYYAVLVFPKGTDLSVLTDMVRKCAADGLKNTAGARNPIRDGNEHVADWGEVFRDAKYIRVSSVYQPAVVDRSKQTILDKAQVYSGCYARAAVRAYAYDKMGNRGVSFGFDALQITRDGEALGGGSAAVGMFDDLPGTGAGAVEDPFAEQ